MEAEHLFPGWSREVSSLYLIMQQLSFFSCCYHLIKTNQLTYPHSPRSHTFHIIAEQGDSGPTMKWFHGNPPSHLYDLIWFDLVSFDIVTSRGGVKKSINSLRTSTGFNLKYVFTQNFFFLFSHFTCNLHSLDDTPKITFHVLERIYLKKKKIKLN